jgi:hypothetical protein
MSTPVYFPASGSTAIKAGSTSVAPLLLARFDSAEIDLEWRSPKLATARFRARELPPELNPPAGETLGQTLGSLAPRIWLYEFTRVFPSGSVVNRYTSYEQSKTYGGYTYAARRITHGEIREGVALDRDTVSIEVDGLDVAPVLDTALLRLETPLFVAILSAELIDGAVANAVVEWTGEVSEGKLFGKKITAKAIPGSTAYDRKVPCIQLQPGCNHSIYSDGCALDPADWVHTATLFNAGEPGYPYVFTLSSLNRSGGAEITAAKAFAGGWFEYGSGTSLQRLPILTSTAVSAGQLNITLGRDPNPWIVEGASVRIYPGCDGKRLTCINRFDNFNNFGGHPFVPTGNPSLIKLSNDAGGGKK